MKLRPNKNSELTRLKRLEPEERAEIFTWKDLPDRTNADIRKMIAERYGVKLTKDGQLSVFWSWQFRQGAMDHLDLMMSQDEENLRDKFPNLSRDTIRDGAIKRGYAVADMMGDVKLTLQVVDRDLKDKTVGQDDRKLVILERKAAQADAAKGLIEDKALSEAERAARMKEVFGVA